LAVNLAEYLSERVLYQESRSLAGGVSRG
jgi:hypothetical protein